MKLRIAGAMLVLLLAAPAALRAQAQPVADAATAAAPATFVEGRLDGEAAGRAVGGGRWHGGGVLGGVTLGLIGTGIAWAMAGNSDVVIEPALRDSIQARGSDYAVGFVEAYQAQVRRSRKNAALGGGLFGTVVVAATR